MPSTAESRSSSAPKHAVRFPFDKWKLPYFRWKKQEGKATVQKEGGGSEESAIPIAQLEKSTQNCSDSSNRDQSFSVLHSNSDPLYEEILSLIRDAFHVPHAGVCLLSDFKVLKGVNAQSQIEARSSLSSSGSNRPKKVQCNPESMKEFMKFVALLESNRELCVIEDCRQDDRTSSNFFVQREPHVRFFAGVSLCVNGLNIGMLYVVDGKARYGFATEDAQKLLKFGRLVSAMLKDRAQARIAASEESARMMVDMMHNLRTPLTSLNVSAATLHEQGTKRSSKGGCFVSNETVADMQHALGQLKVAVESSMCLGQFIVEKCATDAFNTSLLGPSKATSNVFELCSIMDVVRHVRQTLAQLERFHDVKWCVDEDAKLRHLPQLCCPRAVYYILVNTVEQLLPVWKNVQVKISFSPTDANNTGLLIHQEEGAGEEWSNGQLNIIVSGTDQLEDAYLRLHSVDHVLKQVDGGFLPRASMVASAEDANFFYLRKCESSHSVQSAQDGCSPVSAGRIDIPSTAQANDPDPAPSGSRTSNAKFIAEHMSPSAFPVPASGNGSPASGSNLNLRGNSNDEEVASQRSSPDEHQIRRRAEKNGEILRCWVPCALLLKGGNSRWFIGGRDASPRGLSEKAHNSGDVSNRTDSSRVGRHFHPSLNDLRVVSCPTARSQRDSTTGAAISVHERNASNKKGSSRRSSVDAKPVKGLPKVEEEAVVATSSKQVGASPNIPERANVSASAGASANVDNTCFTNPDRVSVVEEEVVEGNYEWDIATVTTLSNAHLPGNQRQQQSQQQQLLPVREKPDRQSERHEEKDDDIPAEESRTGEPVTTHIDAGAGAGPGAGGGSTSAKGSPPRKDISQAIATPPAPQIQQPSASASASAADIDHNSTDSDPHLKILRVLLIEDALPIRKAVSRWLRDHHCEVTVAENGRVGLESLKKNAFDLCLVDFVMPVMGGVECIRSYREWVLQDPHNPDRRANSDMLIIGLSANASSEERLEAFKYGMNYFCPKPAETSLLATILEIKRNTTTKQEAIELVNSVIEARIPSDSGTGACAGGGAGADTGADRKKRKEGNDADRGSEHGGDGSDSDQDQDQDQDHLSTNFWGNLNDRAKKILSSLFGSSPMKAQAIGGWKILPSPSGLVLSEPGSPSRSSGKHSSGKYSRKLGRLGS